MNGAQRIGAELVMLFRREADAIEELKRVRAMIGNMLRDVREMPPDALYVHTGEMPAVTPEPEPEERFEERRIMPMRPDHLDGGSTFALNPLMTAITEQLPAPVSCPRLAGQDCPELHPHLHLADGSVTKIRDL